MVKIFDRLVELSKLTTSKIEELCEDVEQNHIAWLNEVLEEVYLNFGRNEVHLLPKTPCMKRKRERKRRKTIVPADLANQENDEPPAPRASRSRIKQAKMNKLQEDLVAEDSNKQNTQSETTDEQSKSEKPTSGSRKRVANKKDCKVMKAQLSGISEDNSDSGFSATEQKADIGDETVTIQEEDAIVPYSKMSEDSSEDDCSGKRLKLASPSSEDNGNNITVPETPPSHTNSQPTAKSVGKSTCKFVVSVSDSTVKTFSPLVLPTPETTDVFSTPPETVMPKVAKSTLKVTLSKTKLDVEQTEGITIGPLELFKEGSDDHVEPETNADKDNGIITLSESVNIENDQAVTEPVGQVESLKEEPSGKKPTRLFRKSGFRLKKSKRKSSGAKKPRLRNNVSEVPLLQQQHLQEGGQSAENPQSSPCASIANKRLEEATNSLKNAETSQECLNSDNTRRSTRASIARTKKLSETSAESLQSAENCQQDLTIDEPRRSIRASVARTTKKPSQRSSQQNKRLQSKRNSTSSSSGDGDCERNSHVKKSRKMEQKTVEENDLDPKDTLEDVDAVDKSWFADKTDNRVENKGKLHNSLNDDCSETDRDGDVQPKLQSTEEIVVHDQEEKEVKSDQEDQIDQEDENDKDSGNQNSGSETDVEDSGSDQPKIVKSSYIAPLTVKTFIARNTPKKVDHKEKTRQLHEAMKKREVKEKDRKDMLEIQRGKEMEERKKRREERERRVADIRAAKEKETQEKKKQIKEKMKHMRDAEEKARKLKQQEEEAKKRSRLRKKEEADARRRQEEETRLQKIQLQEEEQKRHLEMQQRKQEYEDQERLRRIAEAKKQQEVREKELEKERLLEKQRKLKEIEEKEKRLREIKEEKEREERERKIKEEQEREKERKIRDEKEERERLEKERIEKERAAKEKEERLAKEIVEKKAREEREKREREEKERREREKAEDEKKEQATKEAAEKRAKDEERRLREREEHERKRLAMLLKKNEEERARERKDRERQERERREKERKLQEEREMQRYLEEKKRREEELRKQYSESYAMTPPVRVPKPRRNPENYDITDLRSDESTDDDENPRKKIPIWAQGAALKAAILNQCFDINIADRLFGEIPMPKLEDIFKQKRKRFFQRSSSAFWDSPPLKKVDPKVYV